MTQSRKSIYGATLLEGMLYLSIAALIIIMSIKYYRTATASKQSNDAMSIVQAIVSMADSMAMSTGSYSTGGLTTAAVDTMLPNNGTVPWGSGTVTLTASSNSYTVTLPGMPADVCTLFNAKLKGDTVHYSTSTACPSSGTVAFAYTYTNTGGF